jgi:serine/threonine protein kinase
MKPLASSPGFILQTGTRRSILMQNEIIGSAYKYIIDTSHGINKDGYIDVGSESVVYKGLKIKLDGGLKFSCVLKFKPKSLIVNGAIIDRLALFQSEEWEIYEKLRECRSVVRVDDVLDDLGDFSLHCNKVAGGVIDSKSFFCVVEEFIDGWSLEEFCREEYWKLRKIEALNNAQSEVIDYHDFGLDEKAEIRSSYNYDNTLKFQNQILLFMINLCEIMEFVTEQKNILHLDIKPENIMVTKHGKELVLIDFGKSKKITQANRFFRSSLPKVDYNDVETAEKMFQHGTLGYAAPECYSYATNHSVFPFYTVLDQGNLSIESDIFSFGATFWECLNVFELVTKNKQFSSDPYDFYRESFLLDEVYTNRDLSCTSDYYHKKLEGVIKRCTRKRTGNYTDLDNKDYYHSYRELRRDIENVVDSAPTIEREENVRVRNAFSLCGSMLAVFTVFIVMFVTYRYMAFGVAERKWDELTSTYNETQFYRLEEIAHDLVSTAPHNRVDEVYAMIASFTYQDGDISEYEAKMLVDLLVQIDNYNLLPERIDEIMSNANNRRFKEISTDVIRLDPIGESVGYDLAMAIYNVEVGKTEIPAAYEILERNKDNVQFRSAVIKLRNVLDNDENIKIITSSLKKSRTEVQELFKSITSEETK